MKLNLGCGKDVRLGWVNVDISPGEGIEVVDFEGPLPWEDDSVEEFLCVHTLEHIHNTLGFMQELHRIAIPNALAVFKVPYGSSDEADADQTHVRRFFWKSWTYFGQPNYWRADYGYRGDWDVESIQLLLTPEYAGQSKAEVEVDLKTQRNVVMEMIANLRAVKPIREPKRELMKPVPLGFAIGRVA